MSIIPLQKELAYIISYDLYSQPRDYVKYLFDYNDVNVVVPFTSSGLVVFEVNGELFNLPNDDFDYYARNRRETTFIDRIKKFMGIRKKEPPRDVYTSTTLDHVTAFTIASEAHINNIFSDIDKTDSRVIILDSRFIDSINPDSNGVYFCLSTKNFCMTYYTEDTRTLREYAKLY